VKPLTSADCRHQIIVRRPEETDNEGGGSTTTWSEIGRPWAELIGLDGRESVMNKVLEGVSVRRIRVWYRTDIDDKCQISADGLTLNVRSVADPWGTRRELVIIADTAGTLKNA